MTTFSASLMCGDLLNLKNEIEILKLNNIDYLHMDVMDGHFVPNITFGFDTINAIGNALPKDLHLMVQNPKAALDKLKLYEGDMVTLHIESNADIPVLIKELKDNNVKIGLAINPTTSLDAIHPHLNNIDHILVMTVEPGFAGQPFVKGSHERIKELVELIDERHLPVAVGVDGAIGFEQIRSLKKLKVSHFVLGTSALFNGDLSKKAQEVDNFKTQLGVTV